MRLFRLWKVFNDPWNRFYGVYFDQRTASKRLLWRYNFEFDTKLEVLRTLYLAKNLIFIYYNNVLSIRTYPLDFIDI